MNCTPLSKVYWSQEEKAQKGQTQSVFCTAVNPLNTVWTNQESHRMNTLGEVTTTQYVVAIGSLLKRNGLQFYQTRSHVIILSGTLPAICVEKMVCMKTGEELNCKVHQSPKLPRVTLMPKSQHNRKDLPIADSRKSNDCESEERKHRETCSSTRVYFRIPGIPHSTVEQVETSRKETVRLLIEQFENRPNKNILLKDFEKSEEINHFSKESNDLITEMGNTRPRSIVGSKINGTTRIGSVLDVFATEYQGLLCIDIEETSPLHDTAWIPRSRGITHWAR